MMKRYIVAIFVCFLLSSCSTPPPENALSVEQRFDKQFNIKITKDDNLKLYTIASQWLGTPYKSGGTTKKGTDCSGFTAALYKDVYKKNLSRSSEDMLAINSKPIKRSELREGDLVFFKTSWWGSKKVPNHVGIYLKDGKFVHASTSLGVTVSSLSESYYEKAWVSGGRVK